MREMQSSNRKRVAQMGGYRKRCKSLLTWKPKLKGRGQDRQTRSWGGDTKESKSPLAVSEGGKKKKNSGGIKAGKFEKMFPRGR